MYEIVWHYVVPGLHFFYKTQISRENEPKPKQKTRFTNKYPEEVVKQVIVPQIQEIVRQVPVPQVQIVKKIVEVPQVQTVD